MTNRMTTVADALNVLLADSFTLYIKTKNFHWHVTGPHFREYHLMFDEQAAQILAQTDLIAERVRKLGEATLRSIGDIARRRTLADNDADRIGATAMLAELGADNSAMAERLRALKVLADEAGDNATSGLIDPWTDEAEQRAWFLAAAAE